MAIYAGVGLSKNKDSYQAGYEAYKIALEKLPDQKSNLIIAFASVSFDQEQLIKGINAASGNTPLIGCSDAGEITIAGPTKQSVTLMAIQSDQITFTLGMGRNIAQGNKEAGQAMAREIKEKAPEPLRALIMFPDVLTGNGAEIVRGVLDVLGPHFPLVGGAPGDDFLFEKTYEYQDQEVTSGAVSGIGLSGKFSFGIGVRHGWVPIGIPMKVTKSEGAILHELDNRPAISIYEDYFGAKADDLRKEPLARMAITYPLGIKSPDGGEYLIRDPITVDKVGSITCAAEIPQGSEVRLMIGSKEKAIEAAKEAARKLMHEFELDKATPKLVLMFNCIAREKLFGEKAKEEIDAVMDIIGIDVPLLGFYTYGEQAPAGGEVRDQEKCNPHFYNETIVMFALGE